MFVSKAGSTARNHRVVYLDGYAGPGTYEDGSLGSPSLAAETAERLAEVRELEGHYVEKRGKYHEALTQTLGRTGHTHRTYAGSIEVHLPTILAAAGDAPMFAFFDPFGLGIPFDMLTGNVMGRKNGRMFTGPPTEVLMNFSLPGLRRNAGKKTQSTVLARLDAMLGGDWWRGIWDSESPDREEKIVYGYVERLRTACNGCAWAVVPVSNRWDGPTVYCLIFLTHYGPALWHFNNILSKAMEDFYGYCHQGEFDLDPLAERAARWEAAIASNIEGVLESVGAFTVMSKMKDVYGEAFGFAREMHVRHALKGLYQDGKVGSDVTGVKDLQKFRVLPPD